MYGITKYAAERTCLRLADYGSWTCASAASRTAFGRWEHASGARDRLSPPTEIARIARAGGEAVFPPLGDTDYIYAPDIGERAHRAPRCKGAEAPPVSSGHRRGMGAAAMVRTPGEAFPKFRWRESHAKAAT